MKTLIYILSVFLMAALAAFIVVTVEYFTDSTLRPSYCECLGNQPYIHTKWDGSECLTLVYDPMDYFAGQSMVEYLYSSMQYCK